MRELLKNPSDEAKPRIIHEARHLGPYCHHACSTREERQRRINASQRSISQRSQVCDEESSTLFIRGWPDSLGSSFVFFGRCAHKRSIHHQVAGALEETWRTHALTSRGHYQSSGSFNPLRTSESEMSGASLWQLRFVNEQGESATKAQRTGEPPVLGYAARPTTATSAGWQISGPTPMSTNENEKGGSNLKQKG